MLQKGNRLRKSAPWPPNMSDGDVSRIVPVHVTCIFADPLQKSHAFKRPTRHATLQMKLLQTPHVWLIFGKVLNPLRLPRVIFLKNSTSKSAPKGVHFFQRLNFQKCSNNDLFVLLRNVLRAASVYNLWSLIRPWLSTRRFSEPTFRPSGASKHWKNTVLRLCDFSTRSCAFDFLSNYWLFLFWFFFLWLFPPLLFHVSILSEVWLLDSLWFSFSGYSLLWRFPPLLLHLSICRKFDFQISFRQSVFKTPLLVDD